VITDTKSEGGTNFYQVTLCSFSLRRGCWNSAHPYNTDTFTFVLRRGCLKSSHPNTNVLPLRYNSNPGVGERSHKGP